MSKKELDKKAENLNNRQYKKLQSKTFNLANEIKNDIMPVGSCLCGKGTLFMYLKSNKENSMSYYCDADGCPSIGDIRNPKEGDIIFSGPTTTLDFIKKYYNFTDAEVEQIESKANLERNKPSVLMEETL